MYKYLILMILCVSNISVANVQSGDEIKAVEYNNSKFTVGDVKTSLLPLNKFQELHGSCWIQLNQGADNSNIDITGTDLSLALSLNSIKSSAGRVLRSAGGLSSSLGQTQEDAFQGHQHRTLEGKFGGGGTSQRLTVSNVGEVSSYSNSAIPLTTNSIIAGSHGSPKIDDETRMKNLTVNTFVKVNHDCN